MINKKSQFGDLDKLKITVDGNDVTESLVSLHIFQDMFNPVWQATLIVADTVNSMSKNNYKVEGKVKIDLATRQGGECDGNYNFELYINEISDRLQQSHNTVTYSIHCVGKALLKSQQSKLCKAYKDKKVHEIVQEIVQQELEGQIGGKYEKETDVQLTYIAPNITPINAIGYLLACAKKDKPDFVFYTQDAQKREFTFASLKKIWDKKQEKDATVVFKQRPNFIRENGDYKEEKNKEFSHFVIDHFNYMENISNGMHGNCLCTFDVIKKEWKPSPQGKHNKAVFKFLPKHEGMFDGSNIYDSVDGWWSARRTELFKANQNLIKIQTPGHAKSFEWLGEIARLELPSNDSEKPDQLDKKYKGKYMIVAIGHTITRESYFVNIELANGWDKYDTWFYLWELCVVARQGWRH